MRAQLFIGVVIAAGAWSRAAVAEEPGGVQTSTAAAKHDSSSTIVGAAAGAVPVTARPYYVRGLVQVRSIAAGLETNAGGQNVDLSDFDAELQTIWSAEAGYKVLPNLAVFARFGLLQRYVTDEGEGPFLVRDTALGGKYSWSVPVFDDKKLSLTHILNVYLPTSRLSQHYDLYFAPEAVTRARLPIWGGLYAGVDATFQYRFHKYAEKPGPGAGMNTQLMLWLETGVGYTIPVADVGDFEIGADLRTRWFKRYASSQEFVSPGSDEVFWTQDYGWDVYLFYSPITELGLSISLEQNAPWLRSGISGVAPTREDTEIVFTAIVEY